MFEVDLTTFKDTIETTIETTEKIILDEYDDPYEAANDCIAAASVMTFDNGEEDDDLTSDQVERDIAVKNKMLQVLTATIADFDNEALFKQITELFADAASETKFISKTSY
mmetsp:Transcript_29609/g.27055  ORF Transcript_29609/g.27055 Transcript_29609/m.27055 type:complete len:111 (-) Transcript_29609:675-1007(-)